MSGSVGGVTPGSTQAIEVDTTAISRPDKDHSRMQNENHVTASSSPAQGSSGGSPTDGAREATKPTHKEIEQLAEERAMENPDYAELKAKLEACSGLEDMFVLIDKNVGWRNDDTITMDDILALVNDTNQPNKEARAAAKWLNDHRDVLSSLKKGDDRIGLHDVKEFIAGIKAQLKELKDGARAEIKSESGIKTDSTPANTAATGSTATPATASGADPKAIMEEAGRALPKPPPSQFSGLEGASDNMNNMIGWAEAETDRLTTLMGKTDDPAVLKQLETKINQMSRRMQQMTALMNQLMTAMQNISKMYSEIAMNSVRNMR